MLTDLQKRIAQAIVNVFETGTPRGHYGSVAVIPGDSGHLTYGRSQTTLASGNLALLLGAYARAQGAELGQPIASYLDRVARRDLSLDKDSAFKSLLRQAGDDPVMQSEQDSFFDRVYWAPALKTAENTGIASALGVAVVYDSLVHGSFGRVKAMTGGSPSAGGEEAWVAKYVTTRRQWLATHANPVLHRTVYRMDAFKALIGKSNWELALILQVVGVNIDETSLFGRAASAEDPEEANLSLGDPPVAGAVVTRLQEALAKAGVTLDADGVFGAQTDAAVRLFQSHKNLTIDGIVGPATRAALGI